MNCVGQRHRMSIKILHNVVGIGKSSMGLGQVALNLAKAQHELGYQAKIWCHGDAADVQWAGESTGINRSQISLFPSVSILNFTYSKAMFDAAKSNEEGFHVIHQHGIWTGCSLITNSFRRRHRIPVVIAAHGSLQTYALERSLWKKKIALLAYENENLRKASCLHATAEVEIDDFRNFGLKNPIALIGNGVSSKAINDSGVAEKFLERFNLPENRRILLFLSRITPKKGLPIALQAIRRMRDKLTNWLFVIAGTDEFNHQREVERLVEEFGLGEMIRLVGPLYDQNKLDAFAAADVFILPSYSEGAPMVILDSLAAGVPVLTTKATPWESLIKYQCGWWVEPSVDGLVDALQSLSALCSLQLKEMGTRGKELVRAQYLWPSQAQKTLDLYNWILGKGAKPDFVVCD